MAEGETIIVVSIPIEVEGLEAATAGFEALQAQIDGLIGSAPALSEALSGVGASAAEIDAVGASAGTATESITGMGAAGETAASSLSGIGATAPEIDALGASAATASGELGSLSAANADLAASMSTSTGTTEALVAGLTAEEAAAAQAAAANASLSTSGEAVASAVGSEVAGIAGVTTGLTEQAAATAAAAEAQSAYAAGLAGNAAAEGIVATGAAAMTAADQAVTNALLLMAEAEKTVAQGEDLAAAAARTHAGAVATEDEQVVAMTASLNAEAAALEKSSAGAESAGASAAGMGSGMGMAGMAIAGVGLEALKMSANFQESMSHIESFAGATHAEVTQMSADLLQVSKDTGASAQSLADGLYYVESAGFRGAQAMEIVSESAKHAVAAHADLKTVMDGVTSVMTAFGPAAGDVTHVMDVMTATVSAGKMNVEDFSRSVGTSAAVAGAFGISMEQMGAAIATMTDKGVSARLAFTTFNSMIQGLEKPTAGAQKAFQSLGFTIEELRAGAAENLLGTYQKLIAAANGNMTLIEAMIPNFRALKGVFQDLGSGSGLDDFKSKLDAISSSAGVSAHANEVYAQTTAAAFAKMKAEVSADLIDLGNLIAQGIKPGIDNIHQIGTEFQGVHDPADLFRHEVLAVRDDLAALTGQTSGPGKAALAEYNAQFAAGAKDAALYASQIRSQAADAATATTQMQAAADAAHSNYAKAEADLEAYSQKLAANSKDHSVNMEAMAKKDPVLRGLIENVSRAGNADSAWSGILKEQAGVQDTAAQAADKKAKADQIAADNAAKALQKDIDRSKSLHELETAFRAEAIASVEGFDKQVAATEKAGAAFVKYEQDKLKGMDPMSAEAAALRANIDGINQEIEAAGIKFAEYARLKSEAFKPMPEQQVQTDQLKELNAELVIHESNMLNEVKGSKAWQEDARSVVAIKDTMIPQQKAVNDVVDASIGLVQQWGKELLDGTRTVDDYNQHINKLNDDTRGRYIPGLNEQEVAIQKASQAQTDAGQSAQQLSTDIHSTGEAASKSAADIHAIAEALGAVPADASTAGTSIADIGTKATTASVPIKQFGTDTKQTLTDIGSQANATQTDVAMSLSTMATAATTAGTTINTALSASKAEMTATALGFGLSSAAMATSLDAGATSMGASARAINTAMDTISTKAESVKVVTDAQLSTIGAADIEPAGANGRAIGLALDAGVTAGVVAGASEVAAAASAMVTNAINAAKAAGAIQSPSGIMRDEVGLMMSAGMVEGVQNGAPAVNAAMDTMVTDGYLSAANASKPGAKGPTDLLAAQGQTAEAMYGQANTHGWGVANAFHSGHQAGMKAGTPGTVAVHNDTARVVKESTAPVWYEAGGYTVEHFFKGMNAGLTIQVKDLSHNLADALATVDLGTTEGSKLIREQITLIKDLSTIRHDDAKVAQEVSQLENGLYDKHKSLTAEEISNLQAAAADEKGIALGLAGDLQNIQQKIRDDAAAVQNAIGDDARLAAQNRLKEDMATESEIRSEFHDTYGEWKTDETDLRNAQHQASHDRIQDMKDEMAAYKDMAAAQRDIGTDQLNLAKINGQDEMDTHKTVTKAILDQDIAGRESKRQVAVNAQTTLLALDKQYADASEAFNQHRGQSDEQYYKDAVTAIGVTREAWKNYAKEVTGDFTESNKVVTDDLKALGKTATETATTAKQAESDRHKNAIDAIGDEKRLADQHFSDMSAHLTNATQAQKDALNAQKRAADEHFRSLTEAENTLHTNNDRAIDNTKTKTEKAYGDQAAAHTVMTGTIDTNTTNITAAWLGPGGVVPAIQTATTALNPGVVNAANIAATTSVNAAVRVGVAWSQVPNVMLPLAGALLQVSGTAQATGTQIAAAADTGMTSMIAFLMQTQAGSAQYQENWNTAITFIMDRYGISRQAAETSLSLQLNAAQTTAAGGVTAVVNANAQKTASNKVYHDGVIEQLGRQLQSESQTSAQYAQDWVREINLIEKTFGVSFEQAQEILRNFGDTGVLQLNRVQNAQDGVTGAVQKTVEALYLEGAAATAANKAIAGVGVGDKAAGGASAGGGSAPAGQMTLGDILLKGGLVNGLLASALGGPQAGAFTAVPQTNPIPGLSIPGISGPAGSVSTSTSGGGSSSGGATSAATLAVLNRLTAAVDRLSQIQQQPINLGLGGAMTQIQQLAPALVGMR